MSNDYKVGRGRPPLHTRFRPGQSGNPKGRPKGVQRMGDLISKVLSRKVMVREGGSEREVAALEGLLIKMASKAMQGDHRSAALLLKALETNHGSSGERMISVSEIENARETLQERLEAMAERMRREDSDS